MRLKRILALKGIHHLAIRFGPTWLRSLAFDEKYRSGVWNFHSEGVGEFGAVVRQYLRNGDLLVMGCGQASILEGLEAEGLHSALGVDLAEEAIRLASCYASERVTFQKADMVKFVCPRSYDVILFSESLNYVEDAEQERLLRRMGLSLKPSGVIIVTIAEAKRYKAVLDRIRQNFEVLEDRAFAGSKRHLMVFHFMSR